MANIAIEDNDNILFQFYNKGGEMVKWAKSTQISAFFFKNIPNSYQSTYLKVLKFKLPP